MPIKMSKRSKNHTISKLIHFQSLPIIEIDSLLISWGLLRGKYHNNNTIVVKRKYLYQQWFVIILMILTLPKHIIQLTLNDNSNKIYRYGDIGYFVGHRKIANSIFVIASINSLLLLILFSTKIKRLSWLRVFQLCKKQLSSEDIKLSDVMGNKFWKRVFFLTITTKASCYIFHIVVVLITIVFLYIRWPREWIINGIISTVHFGIWVHYAAPHCFGIILIFHELCYYFKLDQTNISFIRKEKNSMT